MLGLNSRNECADFRRSMIIFYLVVSILWGVELFPPSYVDTSLFRRMTENKMYTDAELIRRAEHCYEQEQLLKAARFLRQVKDQKAHLKERHHKLIRIARLLEEAVGEFLETPEGEWKKQGESHGEYDTSIYYKVESGARLTCRIETPIPKDMVVPILSVLNESSLYDKWIPSWNRPVRMGVRDSKQILNDRKGHQVIQIRCDVPWPMVQREVLMDVVAVDDIEETGCIIVKMQTIGRGEEDATLLPEGFQLPPQENGIDRVDFDGAIMFRACPMDHPNYQSSKQKLSGDLILLQYTMYFDAHMVALPHSVINFVTRVVIGKIWKMLLQVAEGVKNGETLEHIEVMRQKAEFYSWLEDRCQQLLERRHPGEKNCNILVDQTEEEWTMRDVMEISS